jgi:hypothetical protein
VAEVLGLTTNNVRVLLHRGRARLQAALTGYVGAAARADSNEVPPELDQGA